MARPKATIPAYRKQPHPTDPTRDRAFVVIDGKRHYLGTFGSPESRAAYGRVLAEHASGVKPVPRVATPNGSTNDLTIVELVDTYIDYLGSGRVVRPENHHAALTVLTDLYGFMPVREFGSEHLIALQTAMAQKTKRHDKEAKWSPQYVNTCIKRIRQMFDWGVTRKYTTATQLTELRLVERLPADPADVQPAPIKDVERVKKAVSRQVRAMIDLQLLTGARPGEICMMRPIDIETGRDPWEFRPATHNTKRKGKKRVIYLGPQARAVIEPFLTGRRVDAFLFSPREASSALMIGAAKRLQTALTTCLMAAKRRWATMSGETAPGATATEHGILWHQGWPLATAGSMLIGTSTGSSQQRRRSYTSTVMPTRELPP